MAFTLDEIDRYDRQLRLGEWGAAGQERLRAARVTVAGTGPAAKSAVRYLVAAGVGHVACAAPDHAAELNPHVALEHLDSSASILDRFAGAVVANMAISFSAAPNAAAPSHVIARADREACGAACAVEAIKALLGLPFNSEVSLPTVEDLAS